MLVGGTLGLDLVGHDAAAPVGEFAYTLVATDRQTQWTEMGAVPNRAQKWGVPANGNGTEGRLRKAENSITELLTDMKHAATQAWVYGRVLAISAAASGAAAIIARLIP